VRRTGRSKRGFVASVSPEFDAGSAERFVGPLAGLVSRQAIGLVGWRAEAGRCGGESQVVEASSRASRLSSTKSQPSGPDPSARRRPGGCADSGQGRSLNSGS
jgi:hypothetical protein